MKNKILENFLIKINQGEHLIGVAIGSGLSAINSNKYGADLLLVLNSGIYRQMGISSLAGYLPISNSNLMTLDFFKTEIIPKKLSIPMFFGVNASDPTLNIKKFLHQLNELNVAGITNYPSLGLIDGNFSAGLEMHGNSFKSEIEVIRYAKKIGMLTLAFVFNEEQALKMLEVNPDIICVHLGFTTGGELGAKKSLSLKAAQELIKKILLVIEKFDGIKMIYGGPVNSYSDIHYIYNNTNINGYIGGSSFERTPFEEALEETILSIKNLDEVEEIDEKYKKTDYVKFAQQYVEFNYSEKISVLQLSKIMGITPEYFSRLFKKNMGLSFTEYLLNFRINKFLDIAILNENISLSEAARRVGYSDYSHFSKIFKKHLGQSPSKYLSNLSLND